MSFNMKTNFSLYCALLVALMGAPALGISVEIAWMGSVRAGYPTVFICSSSCFSNCIYTWNFEDRTINGSTLTWTPDGRDDTVELKCTVLDRKTGESISTTTVLDIIKNPVSVQTSPSNTVPSVNQSLSLVCKGAASGDPQGPSELIWFKDGAKLTLHENMQLLQNNFTLHFNPLLPSNVGFYHCEAFLPTLQTRVLSSGYLLSVDPWHVTISGPDSVFVGKMSQFTCLTSCKLNVECTVRWQYRGGFPTGTYFSVHANQLKWTPSIPGTFQNFTCIAENAAAGRSAEATKMVEVKGIPISGSEVMKLGGLFSLILIVELLTIFDF
ncbi:uncharacterized protein LOC121641390 [Melanotaenia boesemani]|uniref:uncharacterized protein LOC121641390 n=1 Tax=Melanotaenia boesemani TaxID=1250792 RepID=UPI001C05BD59|nr:uncharacterized protein LOC121641390 [Melanotaenia boesemani]